jgi:mono/diheme cytochrome c family protein
MSREELTVKPSWFLTFLIFALALTACSERIPVGTAVPGAPDVPLTTPVIVPTATPQPATEARPGAQSNASTERGAKVWAEQNCNLCHGDQRRLYHRRWLSSPGSGII